ncbi:MAG: hypothetical protein APF76_04710 [Desulfitibacter sp. BRH_c19]|nr:MAG: hypothetical protein APF76_04710 [Desulfitibacter sp. BRH_c19]
MKKSTEDKRDIIINDAAYKLLKMFETGHMPVAVARTMIQKQAGDSKPCHNWSLGNNLLMIANNTEDARGFKQWKEVDRHVTKGAKAFYILAPITKKITKKEIEVDKTTGKETEVEKQKTFIKGFRGIPVFNVEDTTGKPLPEINYQPAELPPLWEAAKELGLDVQYKPAVNESTYGSFYFMKGKIELYTHDTKTFFHELAHAAHGTFVELKGGQDPKQEIVAEMSSAVLMQMYDVKGFEKHNFDYIKSYAKSNDSAGVVKEIMGVLNEVEKTVEIILEHARTREKDQQIVITKNQQKTKIELER